MAVPTAYLTKANSAAPIFEAIRRAEVPDKFTNDFLRKQLGFTSSSDRPIIAVLKALRFLDESGVPLDRYRRYKDAALGKAVLAEAMRDSYADVFAGEPAAYNLSATALKGIFARISGKGDAVSMKMAATFKALSELADFTTLDASQATGEVGSKGDVEGDSRGARPSGNGGRSLVLRHDIHIHLPASTDIAVYDAIFKSVRENLQD